MGLAVSNRLIVLCLAGLLCACGGGGKSSEAGKDSGSPPGPAEATPTPTPVPISAALSSIAGPGVSVVADGAATAAISIQLKREDGTAATGVVPTFGATDTGNRNTYGVCSASDASGVSQCALSSSWAETKTLQLLTPVAVSGSTVAFTSGGLKLVAPIEMVDYGVSSATSARVFNRSRTRLDTGDYDGTVRYYFEIAAVNLNGSTAYAVELVDQNGSPAASITVPAGTSSSVLSRAEFTPLTGTGNTYRVSLPATAANNELIAFTSRIVVEQTGATRTRIYVPLLQATYSSYSNSDAAAVDTVSGTTYTQANADIYSYFRREDARFATLDPAGAYELDVLLGATNAASTASTALARVSDGAIVASSETTAAGTAVTQRSVALTSDAGGFADGEIFELRLKTDTNSAKLYRAGLWIKLVNLTKAEIPLRIARSRTGGSNVTIPDMRVVFDATKFSNPRAYHEIVASTTVAGGSSVEVYDAGLNVSGMTGATIAGSAAVLPLTKGIVRSGEITNALVSGNSLIVRHLVGAGTGKLLNSCLAVNVTQ